MAACGGGGGGGGGSPPPPPPPPPPAVTIGGTVTGLVGTGLTLQNGTGASLAIAANGAFQFPGTVPSGTPYWVRVVTQPGTPLQFCSAPNGAGVATSNTAINVVCNSGAPRYLYTSDFAQNTMYGFAVDGSTGALSPVANGVPAQTGQWPLGLVVTPKGAFQTSGSGAFGYTINSVDGTISGYSINSTTGALTAVPGSPFTITGQQATVTQMLISPTGRYMYLLVMLPGEPQRVHTYSIQANGALVALAGSPLNLAQGTHRLEIDPLGRWLYGATTIFDVATVATYRVDPNTGVVSAVGTAATGTGGLARGAMHPNGQFVYFARDTKNLPSPPAPAVDAYSVDAATGQLTLIGSVGAGSDQGTVPRIDPLGRFLYVPSVGTGVSGFAINPLTGALTAVPGSPVLVGQNVGQLDIDPTGRFLYAPVRTGAGTEGIAMYTINPATGQLGVMLGSPFPLGLNVTPTFLQAEASGRWVFVASFNDDKVTSLAIHPTAGTLTFVDSETAGTNTTQFTQAGTQ